jgi:polysaccharide biosynthesis/export protein ExoF
MGAHCSLDFAREPGAVHRERGRRSAWRHAAAGLLVIVGFAGASRPAAAGMDGYELGVQDRIRVTVVEWLTGTGELRSPVNGEYTVGPTGFLSLPLIGDVRASGMQGPALADEISKKIQAKLSLSERPLASVEIMQFRPFFVLGDVERPSEYAFRPGVTALRAVSIAGGYYRPPTQSQEQVGRDIVQATGERRTASARIVELQARRARLDAEIKDASAVEFPPELTARDGEPEVAGLMRLEETIFDARIRAFRASVDAQARLIGLYDQEQLAILAQGEGLKRHEEATRRQGENVRALQARGLATMGREYDTDRLQAELVVRQQELSARAIRLQQERVRAEDAVQQAESRRKQEVAVELQGIQASLDDLDQRLLVADKTLTGADAAGLRGQKAVFKVLRQDPATSVERELPANASTRLLPGDILVVQLGQSPAAKLSNDLTANVLADASSR